MSFFGLVTTRTSQSLLITLERLERSCPPVECLDVARVELERLVAVRHRVFVLWRFYAHIARRSIAVEDGLRLGRDGDGARVVLSGDGELSGLVRDIALLLQRRSERLAFLFRFRWNEWAWDNTKAKEDNAQTAYLHPFRAPGSALPSGLGLARKIISVRRRRSGRAVRVVGLTVVGLLGHFGFLLLQDGPVLVLD
jgi:hypothetical protein